VETVEGESRTAGTIAGSLDGLVPLVPRHHTEILLGFITDVPPSSSGFLEPLAGLSEEILVVVKGFRLFWSGVHVMITRGLRVFIVKTVGHRVQVSLGVLHGRVDGFLFIVVILGATTLATPISAMLCTAD